MARILPNWLKSLQEYVEETESPRNFWAWGGIYTISAALERKVWLPFGLDNIYPNLYVMLVAPPGKCRKGSPVSLAKKFLTEIGVSVFVDSPTKRALTKQMAENAATQVFYPSGHDKKPIAMTAIALISKELSSFLATDPKGMIEVLTDLWDSHDEWKYKTSEKGEDSLYNLCVCCFLATTPSWIAANLPQEAIGGGFTSRVVLVSGTDKYKKVPIPEPPNENLKRALISDLKHINQLQGEFLLSDEARNLYIEWYNSLETIVKQTPDERLHGFLERIHTMALKTAMILRVAYSDDLTVTEKDMKQAILLLLKVLENASTALSGHGRSFISVDMDKIIDQIRKAGKLSFGELMSLNWRNVTKQTLEEILESLEAMKLVRPVQEGSERYFHYTKPKPPKEATDAVPPNPVK